MRSEQPSMRFVRFASRLALALLASLVFCACGAGPGPNPTPTHVPPGCLNFDDLVAGTAYHVGDTFTTSGLTVVVLPFQEADGTIAYNGVISVGNQGQAGSTGNEISSNNAALGFVFAQAPATLSFAYSDKGQVINLGVGGKIAEAKRFSELNGQAIGSVNVTVSPVSPAPISGEMGTVQLSGTMGSFTFPDDKYPSQVEFVVGGRELFIDHVCPDSN